jgi:TfoX/Sxy family transcriptional regulator of competence genes
MEKKWEKPSPELIKTLEAALAGITCDRRMMFGSPIFMINRNMFTGVHENHIFVRLPEPDRREIVKKYPEVRSFEPIKGHIMKEYVVIPGALYENKAVFRQWLLRAHSFAVSLPTRASKRK